MRRARRPTPPSLAAALLLAAVPALSRAQQPSRPDAAPRAEFVSANPSSPISQYVKVGDTIYLSGMLGTTAEGQLVPGGIQPETRQTLTNMRATLERAGATLDDVVKCTVFLADMAEWGAMNEAYVPFFPRHRPARSAVGVSGLARNARVEIECLAIRGAGAR